MKVNDHNVINNLMDYTDSVMQGCEFPPLQCTYHSLNNPFLDYEI